MLVVAVVETAAAAADLIALRSKSSNLEEFRQKLVKFWIKFRWIGIGINLDYLDFLRTVAYLGV